MKLWSVRNGFTGAGPVAVLIEAESSVDAIRGAVPIFEARAEAMAMASEAGEFADPSSMSAVEVRLPYIGDLLPR